MQNQANAGWATGLPFNQQNQCFVRSYLHTSILHKLKLSIAKKCERKTGGGRGRTYMSLVPLASAAALRAAEISVNLVNTDLMLPPFSMEMMRQWSSSLTQHKAVFASLWKMPRS